MTASDLLSALNARTHACTHTSKCVRKYTRIREHEITSLQPMLLQDALFDPLSSGGLSVCTTSAFFLPLSLSLFHPAKTSTSHPTFAYTQSCTRICANVHVRAHTLSNFPHHSEVTSLHDVLLFAGSFALASRVRLPVGVTRHTLRSWRSGRFESLRWHH